MKYKTEVCLVSGDSRLSDVDHDDNGLYATCYETSAGGSSYQIQPRIIRF